MSQSVPPVSCFFYTESLQVSMESADIHPMDYDYQQKDTEWRMRHHDDLRDEGFEWCPECGSALIWDLPVRSEESRRLDRAPIVSGDCPPLTAEQLLMTAPSSYRGRRVSAPV